MALTQNEAEVLNAIADSEYGDAPTDPVWARHLRLTGVAGKAVGAVIASLQKKGLVELGTFGPGEETIAMTEAGVAAQVAL